MAQQAKLKTVNIKGKAYTQVFTRINFFRGTGEDGLVWEGGRGKDWSIEVDPLTVNEDIAHMKAIIKDETGRVRATGQAFETKAGSTINRTSHIENCETSAIGRALGNLGIGTAESFASTDEVSMAIAQQATDELKTARAEIERLKAGGASSGAAAPKRKIMNSNWVERYINEMLEKSKFQDIDESLVRFVQHSSDEEYLNSNSPEYLDSLKNAQVSELSCIIPVDAAQHVVKAHTEAVSKQQKSLTAANVLKALMDADNAQGVLDVFSSDKNADVFTAAMKIKVAEPLKAFLDKHKVDKAKQESVFPFLSPSSMKVIKASQTKETV